MAETLLDAVAAEMDAMAAKVAELEDELHEVHRDAGLAIEDLVSQIDGARCEAAKWRRYHDGARAMAAVIAVTAAAGWIAALVGWAQVWGWM